ncbi:unnamed protein product [Durusdinium trenchii]|uniref:Uncharacterized protein n=1 Tax=Durusdinium trenchii TaxID=1381693 RepID=A0ABP0HTX6_9DINO
MSNEAFRSAMKSVRPLELTFQSAPEAADTEREAHLPAKTHLPTEAVNVKVPDSPPAQPSVTSAAVDEELESLRTKLASSTDELRRAQAELTEVSQKSQASQEELTELKEQLAAKDRDLMVVNQKLLASNASNDEEAKKEIAELKRRLEEQEEELKRTKQEVEAAKASHERHIAESQTQAAPPPAAERPTEPGLAEGDFAKRVREAAEVRDLKQQLELEIKSLRGELEGLKAEVDVMRSALKGHHGDLHPPVPVSNGLADVDLFKVVQPLLRPGGERRSQALQAVEVALRNGASPNSWKGPGSPLQSAVQARAPDLVGCLLKAHADPGEIDAHGVSCAAGGGEQAAAGGTGQSECDRSICANAHFLCPHSADVHDTAELPSRCECHQPERAIAAAFGRQGRLRRRAALPQCQGQSKRAVLAGCLGTTRGGLRQSCGPPRDVGQTGRTGIEPHEPQPSQCCLLSGQYQVMHRDHRGDHRPPPLWAPQPPLSTWPWCPTAAAGSGARC